MKMIHKLCMLLLCMTMQTCINVPMPTPAAIVPIVAEPVELTLQSMHAELLSQGVQHADIVLAQAVLETGWFTSSNCIDKNNCFGLYDSYNKCFYAFDSWQQSVTAYVDKFQYKYDAECYESYYAFLQKAGYAEDAQYIDKLIAVQKSIRKRLKS